MIASIRVRGLGPHVDSTITLDPTGMTVVEGPSASGKTSLVDALCFCLWGLDRNGQALPVDVINGEAAIVEIAFKSGTRFRRKITPLRSVSRTKIATDGTETVFSTEDLFRDELKGLGKRVKAQLAAVVPELWVNLMEGPGDGRDLRDLIAGLVPASGLRPVVVRLMGARGFEVRDTDPLDAKGAEVDRRAANRTRDINAGALQSTRDRETKMGQEKVEIPAQTEIDAANRVLELAEVWRNHDAAVSAHNAAMSARNVAIEQRDAWAARKAGLGEKPAEPQSGATLTTATALREHRESVSRMERDLGNAQAAVSTATWKLDQAKNAPDADVEKQRAAVKSARDKLAAAEQHGDTCPTCKRGGWDAAAKALETARIEVKSAEAALAAFEESAPARMAGRLKEPQAEVAKCEKALADLREKITVARALTAEKETAAAEASRARDASRDWERAFKALGDEPKVPNAPTAPGSPTEPRPETAAYNAARDLLARAERARGAADKHAKDLAQIKIEVDQASDALKRSRDEAARLDALVDVIREAPSELAREQLGSLGDISPMSITFVENGGVDVKVDGRSWYRASRGRRIVADLAFRAGLRRALKLPLVLFVDEVQSVGGCDLPDVGGAVVLLRTTDDATLTSHVAKQSVAA